MEKLQKNSDLFEDQRLKSLIELYTTFYPKLFILETLLKSKLVAIIRLNVDKNWFEFQISQNDRLGLINDELEIMSKRKDKKILLNSENLINEASFGFWVEFFNRGVYKELKGIPIKIFVNRPTHLKRKGVYSKLFEIKELRNVIYHHSNIFNTTLSEYKNFIKKLEELNENINQFILMLEPSASRLFDDKKFTKVIKKLN